MAGLFLDTQIYSKVPIPKDIAATGIEGEQINLYDPTRAIDRRNGQDLDNNGALVRILRNSDIDISLRTIGNAFFPRVITVGTTPTLLIAPNRSPRGYRLINPNSSSSGVVTAVTISPIGTVFPVAVTNTTPLDVSAHGGAAFFMDVTEASGGPVSVNLQTQDPVSGNWATAQGDIFQFGPGVAAIGTYYANAGIIGIDQDARLQVDVAGDSLTASLGAILKPGVAGTISGPTIFLGGPDVNTTIGMPILSGGQETFYLKENTAIYAVAVADAVINIFELQ